jgi:hypothetical protein
MKRVFAGALACVLFLAGCAAKKPACVICRRGDPVRVFIQTSHCHDLPDGRYICDKAIFDPQTVKAK